MQNESGRRDLNPRPSPWQGDLEQLRCLRLHTFINVLLGFLLTAVDRYAPLLSMLCAFFVVHVPRIFAPHAPRMCASKCRNPHLGKVMLTQSAPVDSRV